MPEVVLDRASIGGLLRMAEEEGLLQDKQDYGDRFLYSLKHLPLPDWHRQQILEQIILNTKIHSINPIPFDWMEGEFLASNLIHVAEQPTNWNSEGKSVSPDVIEGMLLAGGNEQSFDELASMVEKFLVVQEEAEIFEAQNPGAKIGDLSTFVTGMVNKEFRESEQFKLTQKWNQAHIEARPLLSTVEEYIKLSDYASSTTGYLKTPVYRLSANLVNLTTTPNESESLAVRVYRITTNELGFVPVCSSLRQALEISRNQDVIALRHQIDQWLKSLSQDSADITTKIQSEIRKAIASLTRAKALRTAGQWIGYISIPISAIGLMEPLLGAIGFSLDCVAVICDRTGKSLSEPVRWVGLGSHKA